MYQFDKELISILRIIYTHYLEIGVPISYPCIYRTKKNIIL